MIFRCFFLLFTASIQLRPPGQNLVPRVSFFFLLSLLLKPPQNKFHRPFVSTTYSCIILDYHKKFARFWAHSFVYFFIFMTPIDIIRKDRVAKSHYGSYKHHCLMWGMRYYKTPCVPVQISGQSQILVPFNSESLFQNQTFLMIESINIINVFVRCCTC